MTVSAIRTARHVHLVRAAALAGEAFAPTAEDARPARRLGAQHLVWAAVALVAAGALMLLV
jgi:hypothetical protein